MLSFSKWIRDPLYGFVGLTETEVKLLDTPPLQRLRRIKQLANAHLVYPSAMHTRFEHSLGVMHIAGRMAEQLQFNDEDVKAVRYAGLLHDVGKCMVDPKSLKKKKTRPGIKCCRLLFQKIKDKPPNHF